MIKPLTVVCPNANCPFSEDVSSYEHAEDLWDEHHTVTGHRPDIEENSRRPRDHKIICDDCGDIGSTDFYKRAKKMKESHHIYTGCHPRVKETN